MNYRHISALFASALLILCSCQPKTIPEGPWLKKIDSEEYSKLVINYSAKLKAEQRLHLEDSWISYDDNVKKMCLRYSTQRLMDVYEARLLLVELVEGLLERINTHTTIGFELEHSPFTANDLDVRINCESFYGIYCDPLYVGLIWLQAGCSHFYAFDYKNNDIDWSHDRFEPYFKSKELALIKKEADIPYTKPPEETTKVHDAFIRSGVDLYK